MQVDRTSNRWLVVLGSLLIQLSLGAIYAWSVFTPALRAAGWSKVDTQIVFAVGLVTFALTMVFSGRAISKLGPRKLVVIGGLMLGAGYALTGFFGGTEFWAVCLGVGLVGGAGIGMGYVVPIAVGMRWFPDKKGMITGLAVAGFGFGAMGWVKMAGSWGHLIELYGLSTTFLIYGGIFSVLILVGSLWMTMPPKDWKPEGFVATTPAAIKGQQNFTVQEMLRTPQFFLLFLTFAVSAGAGLMSIGLMKLYPMEALQAAGYGPVEASAIAGTAMAVFFSLANGVGRIAWGTLSDKIGRRRSVVVMTSTQAIFLFGFTGMAGNEYLLYLGAMLIGFNFGGNFALFPTLTADIFGNDRVGQNYPFIFLSYGVGGIAGPLLGGMLGDMGNFPLAFSICGIACLVGAACTLLIHHPDHDEAIRPASVHGFLHQMHLDHLENVIEYAQHPDHFKRVMANQEGKDRDVA
ncbi:MAG: OFA family MFS transporter [Rhodospirillaceae bacterium]|jgi:MFS transporter, OFA family, oxalate/formate antiporter|nr:OFA family MFS transporter [Rhodospirillaceae bacterium]MBT5036273.1 OFA family MFS transporter [Rhodospirillaceae bacterium]MBT6218922.1 OFA family MFS transporter [Rhodospirillaceae bacterium]MBT6362871.1 OFA family MFS transporter [Rhodospirillaceae bacterium]